jgi:hypothetical protein
VNIDLDYISTPRVAERARQNRSKYREEKKEGRREGSLIYFSALCLP